MKRCNVAKCGGDTEKNDSEATKTKVTSSSKNLRRKADLVSLPRYLNESSTASSHSFYSAYGSVDSDSSPGSSEYSDAMSHFSGLEDAKSSDENDDTDETARVDNRSIPVSSSLVDLIGGINRVVAVVSHFGQLLCPKQPTTTHDSLRLSPEGLSEMKEQLEAGHANMAKKLSDVSKIEY